MNIKHCYGNVSQLRKDFSTNALEIKMGSGCSKLQKVFKEDDLKAFMELTYLTPHEILQCYEAFCALDPERVDQDKNVILPMEKIQMFPGLKANPFKDRICKVFSSTNDGNMSFEDFLDMMSTFNEKAPKEVKIEYAFRIYDFDDDDFICKKDLFKVMRRLFPKKEFNLDMIRNITEKILEEADFNEDGGLCFDAFHHVIQKDPDFLRTFRISC